MPVVYHPSKDFDLGVFDSHAFFRDAFRAFGIGVHNLILAEEDLRVDLLYYPDTLSIYHEYVHPLMGRVIDHLIQELGRPRSPAARGFGGPGSSTPRRLYLSRSRWRENLRIDNEPELEAVFAERGFAIVHCLGIVTSMFSAVMFSRGLVNLWYGRQKRLKSVSIGQVWKPGADATAARV